MATVGRPPKAVSEDLCVMATSLTGSVRGPVMIRQRVRHLLSSSGFHACSHVLLQADATSVSPKHFYLKLSRPLLKSYVIQNKHQNLNLSGLITLLRSCTLIIPCASESV